MTDVSEGYARHQAEYRHLHGAFGADRFGAISERVARFFGTPRYIMGQTLVVIVWIALNGAAVSLRWDPYPFILLNLAFSTQAAYAAPLILLAQTRQAERDKVLAEADAQHREALADASMEREKLAVKEAEQMHKLLEQNTALTQETKKLAERIDSLTAQLHATICKTPS